ncbi:MAG TPA: 4-vinyl reductase [Chloroflexi bacterium]|nr:4-vinyl reductase [Chloroflexota bacterium]
MSSDNESGLYYPNRWVRIILIATEEIVGKNGVNALLNMGGLSHYIDNYPPDNMKKEVPFEHVAQLQQAYWDMYGPRGARAFAIRSGKKTFNDGLDSFGTAAKAARMAMKIGTLEKRIGLGLQFFAKFFNQVSDQRVAVDEDEHEYRWHLQVCPMCYGEESDSPLCYLAVGVLQGALENFADPTKHYRVTPIKCIAMGDEEGIISIDKDSILGEDR